MWGCYSSTASTPSRMGDPFPSDEEDKSEGEDEEGEEDEEDEEDAR